MSKVAKIFFSFLLRLKKTSVAFSGAPVLRPFGINRHPACSKLLFAVSPFLLLFFMVSCSTISMDRPKGFAEYPESSRLYYAVSPDAVRLRVRQVENRPLGSVAVIRDTMKIHFDSNGYEILKSEPVTSSGGLPGHMFVTSVRTLNGEYRYLAAFFLDEDQVFVVEASGKEEHFTQYEKDISNKLKSIHLK